MHTRYTRAPKLGIVGGLGALAGADLLYRLVAATPVKSEEDHREIHFEQRPLHETVLPSAPGYSPFARKFYVFDTLSRMERDGCEIALLPCFVSHTFLDELRSELGIHIVDMMRSIGEHLARLDPLPKTIGVITTPYVRDSGLFERVVPEGLRVEYPSDAQQQALIQAIYGPDGFKSGKRGARVTDPVEAILQDFRSQGITTILSGMTEIPLLLPHLSVPDGVSVIDTNALYAAQALIESDTVHRAAFKIGVVGGVGPAATVDFLDKIVSNTNSARDQDHVKILVEQNPQIPDRTENLMGEGTDPTIALYSTAKKLERGGADIIAIPCNTAHAYVERIQRHLDIPIVSILTETTQHIVSHYPNVRKVGILATNGTVGSGLYQTSLEQAGLEPVVPDEAFQALVMESIYGPNGVKAGHTSGKCRQQLLQAVEHVLAKGADAVILGCTELPLIAPNPQESNAIALDPTLILARKCVALASDAEGV